MMAFMTSRNKPRVKIVAGKVKIISSGLTVTRKSPRTIATRMALVKLATSTPGSIAANTITATAVSSILNSSFMVYGFLFIEHFLPQYANVIPMSQGCREI